MSEPMSPEGSRQPVVSISSEQLAPREKKQFSIKVDGKETRYDEDYPFPFIADGAPLAIRRIMGGMSSDREELGRTIDSYLRPSQQLFENADNLPNWYQALGPVLEKSHLSLDDLKPADIYVLGDDFRWALEDIYNFPFSKQLQIDAARSMGQTEGTVPTLSVLIQTLQTKDPEQFAKLVEILLKRGPDGFAMAAYLVAPEEEKAEKEEPQAEEFSFDKIVSTKDGQPTIDTQAMRELINTMWKGLQWPREDISHDVNDKIDYPGNYRIQETPPKE